MFAESFSEEMPGVDLSPEHGTIKCHVSGLSHLLTLTSLHVSDKPHRACDR